eukprot:TRINITY_DN323_c0_g1_i2.p1 TRINITY_DN323_c0_g1~~TRINITY_DN323_c0_g1_i2.p1  ORF type:complete len:369 (+),score=138.07 TRINITY_DN323_c0_g1_i2:28-1107(+)
MPSPAALALMVGSAVLAVLAVASHVSAAHVRTQPVARPHALATSVHNPSLYSRRSVGPNARSQPQPIATTTALRAGPEAADIPWLSLTAIALSLGSVTATLLRDRSAAAPVAASAAPLTAAADDNAFGAKSNMMDEVAQQLKVDQARRKDLTPGQVIRDLQRGNARFWSGTPERPEVNAMERRALIIAQAPTVCIVSCADSRVPVEIVFDQGLGSVFVVRVAGNIIDSVAMGSIEFSVKYLGVKAVLVMGHEACGAVKGAFSMSEEDIAKAPAYLQTVLKGIKQNLDVTKLKTIQDYRAQDREAVVVNTTAQVKRLQENALVKERLEGGSLLVCGAFYEITSGIVDFFTLDKNGLVVDV